jgi:hypothetical protein
MTVYLRLSRCPGIQSITINGRPISPTSPDRSEFGLSLPRLSPRNELVIEAEPPRSDVEWGAISLDFVSGIEGPPGMTAAPGSPPTPRP